MAKIKVGVIGVGSMGENHLRIYSTLKEANLVGFFEPNPERAGEIASKYNCRAFPDLESLLNEVSAASLVNPTSLHFETAKKCLEKKVRLLVEKPLTATAAEAEELAGLAEKNKLVLAAGMIERFNPAFKKLASLVRHEHLLGLELKRFSPFPARISDASVVLDMMFHDIDLALALSRTEVASLKASGKKVQSDKLDEATATLYFKDGLIARIEASRVRTEKKREIVVTAERAIYTADLLNKRLYKRDFDRLTEKEEIEVQPEDQLTLELKDFLHAVGLGRDPKVPGRDSIAPIALAQEVEKLSCS